MSKTTFLGYVPSLKSKHEATIVGHKAIQSKGGSIRYTLQGEYDGRKTLPKTVSKADFESVYGFDAKEAEAVIVAGVKDGTSRQLAYIEGMTDKDGFTTEVVQAVSPTKEGIEGAIKAGYYSNHAETVVGNPSPASVEPPAPSDSPFPQEPSNENFSAEDYGWVITHKDSGLRTDSFRTKSQAEKYRDELKQNKTLRTGMKIVKANSNDEPITPNILNYLDVKEAFGFGKDEESEEPKTQEFTVVLQEGDKLELTDIAEEEQAAPDEQKEEDSPEESENEEKEADEDMVERTFFITDAWYDTYDETDEDSFEDQYGYNQSDEQPKFEDEDLTLTIDAYPQEGYGEISDSLVDALSNSTGFGVYHFSFVEIMPDGSKKVLEAVQAKVTRPVKEDETEEESEEGLSTGAKVALGVGALAAGVALFGAEEYPQEFLDEFYDFDSNPTADTQDEETLAIAYAAWKHSKENTPYEAETDYTDIYGASGSGEKEHDMIAREEEVMYEFRYDNPITTYDWTTAKETVSDEEEDYIHDAISDEIGNEPYEGDDNFEIDVEDVGSVDVDTYTDYGDKRHYGLAAEHESESDGFTYAYSKGHKDGMKDEVVYRPSIDTDREKNIYKKILRQKAETFEAGNMMVALQTGIDGGEEPYYNCPYCRNELTVLGGKGGIVAVCENESRCNGLEVPRQYLENYDEYHWYHNERNSDENMEAEGSNMKMALGILGVGIGAVALLGGDRIKKMFDRFGL